MSSMALVSEVCIFGFSVYYLYRLLIDYKKITSSKKFYEEHRTYYIISFIGVICLISSFQVYWFTSFYDEHKYIAILVKIILEIFSIFNQMLITDIEKENEKIRKKKKKDIEDILNEPMDKKFVFKLVNRLFLLDIVVKIFGKK